MDFFALHSVMNAKNMVTTHSLDANRLWATRMAYGTKNWCSIEMTWQRSHLAQPWTSLCFPYLLIECTAYFFCSCSKSLPAFFFFFPFRFSLFSLHPEFLSPLRVISHFVSFLVSLCGPYCSVSGMKSLSLPSVLCSGSWLHYPHLTSSFFSRRSNVAYWPFSLCWRCAGFFPTPKLTLASQDSYRRLSP